MAQSYESDGTPAGRNYILYAYCLMSNHIHLLIREREDNIGMAIKRIASSYVYYYNHKYSRDGHLFRERFKSEPVNDIAYFVTLLRYIHQNPVKAGMVAEVKDYEFSSWDEYIDKNSTLFPLQQLPADIKKSLLIELKGKRASLRQLERLTGISKSMIYRM